MAQSHYQTLGVTEERAEQAHPDKQGGDHDAMAQINRAYDVLSDPDRRLLYDATGKDSQQPEADRVRTLVMQAFLDALQKDAPNVLRHTHEFIENGKAQINSQKDQVATVIKKLQKRRNKLKTRAEINVFHLIVDQQIIGLKRQGAVLDNDLRMYEQAIAHLDSYKSSEKPPQPQTVTYMFASSASTGGF